MDMVSDIVNFWPLLYPAYNVKLERQLKKKIAVVGKGKQRTKKSEKKAYVTKNSKKKGKQTM